MRLRSIWNKLSFLHKTDILRQQVTLLTITLLGQLRHLTVEVPESVMAVAFILQIRSRFCTAGLLREACRTYFSLRLFCTRTPTFGKPAVAGIQFLQGNRFVPIRISGNPVLYGFLQKKTDIIGCTVCHIEMSPTGIAKKRNATLRIHHTKSQSRIDTRFPPFVLSFDHQTGNTVDVARAPPLQVSPAVACQVGARSVTVIGNYCQGTFRIPCGEVPRESSHCRMPHRNNRDNFQLIVAARLRQTVQCGE